MENVIIFLIRIISFVLLFAIILIFSIGGASLIYYSNRKNINNFRDFIVSVLFVIMFVGIFIVGFYCAATSNDVEISYVPVAAFIIIMFVLIGLVSNDNIWNILFNSSYWIRYIIGYIRISVFKNFYFKNNNFTLEFVNENWQNNIYCFNNRNQVCLIREIDNLSSTTSFMKILYENFYNGAETTLNYEEFIKFANENDMFIRTYSATNKNSKKHIKDILKDNNIFIEPKKININTATENEIINLPFINIIHTKKIIKYIQENGSFKSFWDFAEFMNLKPNQGEILSKLVFVKPLKENIKSETVEKYDKKLDI